MLAVLTAIGSMACIIALGWVIQRRGLLAGRALNSRRASGEGGAGAAHAGADAGAGPREILATLSFTICAPALMFATLASTDLAHVLSRGAAVTWTTTAVLGLATAAVARWLLRLPSGPGAVTTLAAVYVNGGNIGIPLAVYLFDDALAVVPTLLFQLLVLAPLTLSVLDRTTSPGGAAARSVWRTTGHVFLAAFRNPITLGTVAGLLVAVGSELTGARLPDAVLLPFDLIGGAAPPLGLLTFGMTLAIPMPPTDADLGAPAERGRRVVGSVITLAVLVRNVLHPLAAWALGSAVGLEGAALAVVVTMAALPTAVNVTTYATRYGVFDGVAARATVWTTALCAPVLILIAPLLT